MSAHPDVLILGGGVIGLTTAYYLAREGARVAIVDKGDLGQEASWAGAGILPPASAEQARAPIDLLRALSAALHPLLAADLKEQTGIDNGYVRCGGLEIAHDANSDEWRGAGIAFETLRDRALRQLEPALAPSIRQAYLIPDMAQLRNPRHLKALRAACAMSNVAMYPGCAVLGWETGDGRILAAKSSAGLLHAGRFVVAAGAWSDGLLEMLGCHVAIRPIRGQIVLLQRGVPLFRRVLVHGPRYLVPRPDGRVLIGSTEEDVGFDKRTTAGAIADLLHLAVALVPNLANAPLERCWAGLRPGSPDGLPFLGSVPSMTNAFVASGHFRSGIQLSAATGLVMKELLLDKPPSVPVEAFRLERIATGTPRPAFRS